MERLQPLDPSTRGQPRGPFVRVVTTLVAWIAAFVVVMVLLVTFGPQIASQPVPIRAMLISGVVVTVMVNPVMQVLNRTIARGLSETRPQLGDGRTSSEGPPSHE